ncbi:TetR/AcrR family transcriptional regulator [Microbacterium aoyamense]|uniref:TetR/AcrR family transcriptional regulator n=1 Tax=Microbacterium aoyamense TaxID=344166 RepID=A0ABN2PJ79_9MICO|nr:TetR/AcrR family transcriptional regulator [Microbacterium aoyamense]
MTSDKRQRPRSRPGTAVRRREILTSAVEIFGSKGSTNGTLSEVADQVGLTRAGVLHHFGSKENLLLEVLAFRDRSDVADLAEQHIPGGPELFLHLVRTAFANARRPGIVQAFTVLSAEAVTEGHPARTFFDDRYSTLRREIGEAFRSLCAQEGVTESETVDAASAAILAVMDGLQLQWLLDSDTVELGEASEFAIRAIVNAVLAPGPELSTYVRARPAGPRT